MSRYRNSEIKENSSESTKVSRERRGKEFINHYSTKKLPPPPRDDLILSDSTAHVWSVGDKFYKLAQLYYNDPKLWWVVAWYNQKPTEGHVEIGDTILIPRNVDDLLFSLGY